jgi:hypothetical protein
MLWSVLWTIWIPALSTTVPVHAVLPVQAAIAIAATSAAHPRVAIMLFTDPFPISG